MGTDDEVLAAIEAGAAELVGLCADLVAAPSVSPPGDTRAVAEVVRAALVAFGLEPEVTGADPSKPSVLAGVAGVRPGRHLVMNVHLDTMPAGDESAWSVDPWRVTERDGRLYGLGMGNMKGAVAAMVAAVGMLHERRGTWEGRISFAAVADEVMFGPDGAAWLLETRPDLYGDALICGEGPGWMRLAVAEKGVAWYAIETDGPSGHASGAEAGTSAIAKLAAIAATLDAVSGRRIQPPPELAALGADDTDPGGLLTCNVGTFEGGTVVSQRSVQARATLDLRLPPGFGIDAADALVAEACAAQEGARWQRLKGWEPNWTDPAQPIAEAMASAAERVRGVRPALAVRLPASDASRWRARGIQAVCFGPQPTLSAGVDDYAERQDVIDCAGVYALAALRFLNG